VTGGLFPLGQPVTISTKVTDAAGNPVTPGTLTAVVSIRNADGTTWTVTGTYDSPVSDSPDTYHQDIPAADLTQPGHYLYEWIATGAGAGAEPGTFDVYDPLAQPAAFASAADAAAYGFTLPASPDGLLARATQAIRDEAGIPLTQVTSTLRIRACRSMLELPTPLVTSVTTVALVNDDGSTTPGTDWEWHPGEPVQLGDTLTWEQRHQGLYEVTYIHGFAVLPPALVMLACAVAYRMAATPAGAAAGLKSRTVGSVSWTAGETPGAALTAAETDTLARIVPLRRVWQVALSGTRRRF
jgi:hypothetical protein